MLQERNSATFLKVTIRSFSLQLVLSGSLLLSAIPSASAQQQGFDARPFELGTSGGNINSLRTTKRFIECCSGTLGSLVQDSGGKQYILSNNHVLARESTKGHHAAVGESISQPGLIDSGCQSSPSDVSATLTNWVPLQLTRKAKNVDDAAIAEVIAGDVDPSGRILNIGTLSPTIIASSGIPIGLAVQKMGRTTGSTTGQVSAVDATVLIRYAKECNSLGAGVARFLHQIVIDGNFAGPGDSGSLIATRDKCPSAVGLLFAGGTDNGSTVTFANPIDSVLSTLNVSIVGTCNSNAAATELAQNESPTSATPSAASDVAFEHAMANAKAVKDRHDDEMMNIPGVVGTAVGNGDAPGQAAIEVYVKKDTAEIRKHVPPQVEGVPVIIRETGDLNAY